MNHEQTRRPPRRRSRTVAVPLIAVVLLALAALALRLGADTDRVIVDANDPRPTEVNTSDAGGEDVVRAYLSAALRCDAREMQRYAARRSDRFQRIVARRCGGERPWADELSVRVRTGADQDERLDADGVGTWDFDGSGGEELGDLSLRVGMPAGAWRVVDVCRAPCGPWRENAT